MFWKKTFVDSVEEEFKTSKLRNKRIFHDVNLRVADPDELRANIVDYLRGLDFYIILNEMTEFEESDEFAKFFRGGRLKPIKSIIKASKQTMLGTRHPKLVAFFFLAGLISTIFYLLPYQQLNKITLFYFSITSFILSGLFFLVKKIAKCYVWIKIVGIYDVEGLKADVRLVLSADGDLYDELRDEVAELYHLISRKYFRFPRESIVKPSSKSKQQEIIEKIIKINNDERELRDKLIRGKISEELYNNVMNSLEHDKEKLETILELISSS